MGVRVTDPMGHTLLLPAPTGSGTARVLHRTQWALTWAGQGCGSALGSQLQVLLPKALGSGWEGSVPRACPSTHAGPFRGDPRNFPNRSHSTHRSHVAQIHPQGPVPAANPSKPQQQDPGIFCSLWSTAVRGPQQTCSPPQHRGSRGRQSGGPSSPLPARPPPQAHAQEHRPPLPPACPLSFSCLSLFLFHLHH